MMTIPREKYNELKPFYDFQRKKEYNKEQLKFVCDHVAGVDQNWFFDEMWIRLDEKNYLEPSKYWIPKNEKFRIEGE
ncbi:MAG: hypothetical protein H8D92_01700 [Pelagibacteraceae bacterium]|nr:hypothetical protein [Pelagibacteraceae bacterium]